MNVYLDCHDCGHRTVVEPSARAQERPNGEIMFLWEFEAPDHWTLVGPAGEQHTGRNPISLRCPRCTRETQKGTR